VSDSEHTETPGDARDRRWIRSRRAYLGRDPPGSTTTGLLAFGVLLGLYAIGALPGLKLASKGVFEGLLAIAGWLTWNILLLLIIGIAVSRLLRKLPDSTFNLIRWVAWGGFFLAVGTWLLLRLV
jgi:hypothetical protein